MHGTYNARVHVFPKLAAQYAARQPNVHRHVFYNPLASYLQQAGHYGGIMDLHHLSRGLLLQANFCLRRPEQDLAAPGLPRKAIHAKECGLSTRSLLRAMTG